MIIKYYINEQVARTEYREYGGTSDLLLILKEPWKCDFSETREIRVTNIYTGGTNRLLLQRRDGTYIQFYHVDRFFLINRKSERLYIGYTEYETLSIAEEECRRLRGEGKHFIFEVRKNKML